MEAKLKQFLGEQLFAIIALQAQVEHLQTENGSLRSAKATKEPKAK